jgi:hypothetical protein
MATVRKDNRLLPRGWSPDGPHADRTAPVGTQDDDDFVAGSDTVTYRVGATGDGPITIDAWLLYQSIPPGWVDPLRSLEAEDARRFVRMYDAADPRPEVISLLTRKIE